MLNRTSNKTDIDGYAGKLKTMLPSWTEIRFYRYSSDDELTGVK
jgi:hypothetical protein